MIDKKTFEPKILEMTFSPDCDRACKYDPPFYEDIFKCFYLNQDNEHVEKLI